MSVPSWSYMSVISLNLLALVFPVLNPYAPVYISLENRRLENTALIAIICTIDENDRLEFNNKPPTDILKKVKLKNANKIIIGHLNINCIRNKIEDLKYLISENIDIL